MIIDRINFFFNKGLPNWNSLLKNSKKKLKKKVKKKILLATLSGGHKVASTIDSMIGVSLDLQGAEVSYLLCDQFLSGCIMKTHRYNTSNLKNEILNEKLCKDCFKCRKLAYKGTNFNFLRLSNFYSSADEKKIKKISLDNKKNEDMLNFKIGNINIGEQVSAGISRYYAVSNFYKEKNIKIIIKEYFISALKTYFSIKRLTEEYKFETIIVNHGFYVPQGIIAEIANLKKIHYVTWTTGARKNSFMFSHNNIYYKDFVSEPINKWKKINLKKIEKKINYYLESKVLGSQDYNYKKNKVNTDIDNYFNHTKIDLQKPLIGLTTNVIWDAQLHFDNTIFKNMMEWVFETINFFIKNPHLNLIIRVHPTEINSDRPAREKVADEIYNKFNYNITKNIIIVESHDPISTYSILNKCKTILTYGTKLDIEYAARGYPVIVAGEAITRNKNLVIQPKDKKEYFSLLQKLPFKKRNNYSYAKKFAYHYFFRKSILIKSLKEKPFSFPPFKIKDNFIKDLPKDKNLKVITNGILKKTDFTTNND
jgi:hypothetical protein